jgi:hypothetical protein
MIDELADLLDNFPGEANRTRRFTHVINLVAKSIIKQFDVPQNQVMDEAADVLAALAVNIDNEERISRESSNSNHDEDEDEDDNNKGWSDVRQELSEEERQALDKSLQPVRLVLVKASHQLI